MATGQKTLNTGRGQQMMSRYVNTERVTSAGVSVMRFASWPWQPPFVSASDGAGPVHYNCVTGKHNKGHRALATLGIHKG